MALNEFIVRMWTVLGLYLDVVFTFWHWSEMLQDLVVEADLEVLEPDTSLVIHCMVKFLEPLLVLAVFHLKEKCC